ncbi:MAG TPA: uroporphyrinogen decarboxylase family protein, partial [Negativicutes bacterium]
MKTKQEILNERTVRLKKAIALEKTDRTPVILSADAFCANHMGVKLSDFCSTLKFSNEIMLKSAKALGDFDGISNPIGSAQLFPMIFAANVKMPGKELPDNALWQLDEQEMMTREDYDTILDKGWGSFFGDYLTNRLGISLGPLMEELAQMPQFNKNFEDEGYLVYCSVGSGTVNELLGGGRTLSRFIQDLYKIPDKVEAVLDVIQKETVDNLRQQIRATKPTVVFLSPARGASEFFSQKLWNRFVWKYLKGTVDAIIEEGAAADIHIDGNWTRDLEQFNEFPKGKCIFETDGTIDIYKIKEV